MTRHRWPFRRPALRRHTITQLTAELGGLSARVRGAEEGLRALQQAELAALLRTVQARAGRAVQGRAGLPAPPLQLLGSGRRSPPAPWPSNACACTCTPPTGERAREAAPHAGAARAQGRARAAAFQVRGGALRGGAGMMQLVSAPEPQPAVPSPPRRHPAAGSTRSAPPPAWRRAWLTCCRATCAAWGACTRPPPTSPRRCGACLGRPSGGKLCACQRVAPRRAAPPPSPHLPPPPRMASASGRVLGRSAGGVPAAAGRHHRHQRGAG